MRAYLLEPKILVLFCDMSFVLVWKGDRPERRVPAQPRRTSCTPKLPAQPLSSLHAGDPVLIKLEGEKGWKKPGVVLSEAAPRSYNIATPDGAVLRRNRSHLRPDTSVPQPGATPAVATPASANTGSAHPSTGPTPSTPTSTRASAPLGDSIGSSPAPGTPTPTAPTRSSVLRSPGQRSIFGRKINKPICFRDE